MKNLKNIEETAEQLTETQKDNVLKANRTGILLILLNTVLVFAGMTLLTVDFLKTKQAHLYFDGLVFKVVLVIIAGIALSFAEYFVIKKKVPYYDDKVCRYIKKSRKVK